MQDEYINKIIEIGKKESCTPEELTYFLANLPNLGNKELNDILQRKYKINIGHITRREFLALDHKVSKQLPSEEQKKRIFFLIDFIKGCHLIEIKYGGFGSTTNIYNIIGALMVMDVNEAINLYNWIAFNGGNYYIESGVTFMESKKREQDAEKNRVEILANDQRLHLDAEAKKQQNRDLHTQVSNEARVVFNEFRERFQKMDDKQLIATYNEDIKKQGWVGARGRFHAALSEELKKRGLNPKHIN